MEIALLAILPHFISLTPTLGYVSSCLVAKNTYVSGGGQYFSVYMHAGLQHTVKLAYFGRNLYFLAIFDNLILKVYYICVNSCSVNKMSFKNVYNHSAGDLLGKNWFLKM